MTALNAGASAKATFSVTIPADTAAGSYHIVAESDADGIVGEGNETNNSGSVPIQVTSPPGGAELVVVGTTIPATAAPGSMIAIRCVVENQGGSPAVGARVKFYFSNDAVTGGDVYLGSRSIVLLLPGRQAVVDLKVKVPPRAAAGTRYLLVAPSSLLTAGDVHAEPIAVH